VLGRRLLGAGDLVGVTDGEETPLGLEDSLVVLGLDDGNSLGSVLGISGGK